MYAPHPPRKKEYKSKMKTTLKEDKFRKCVVHVDFFIYFQCSSLRFYHQMTMCTTTDLTKADYKKLYFAHDFWKILKTFLKHKKVLVGKILFKGLSIVLSFKYWVEESHALFFVCVLYIVFQYFFFFNNKLLLYF